MKLSIIQHLRNESYEVHGCAPRSDGKCYYLISLRDDRDYGDKDGRRFKAVRETLSGSLEFGATLAFFVSRSALRTARVKGLIGEFEKFLIEAGVGHLCEMLKGDLSGTPHKDIELNSNSPDKAFEIPVELDPLTEQRNLRFNILGVLAKKHSAGEKLVTKASLFEDLCTHPNWVVTALNILTYQKLIDEGLRGEIKLLPAGFLEAEEITAGLDTVQRTKREQPGEVKAELAEVEQSLGKNVMPSHAFDLFVSYASQDRESVKNLVSVLEERGMRVWWDKGQIKLGDKLSQKIDEGLRSSKYGVVIISSSFVAKHWPENELRSMLNRSISSGEKVILPALLGLTHTQFAEHYPLMADIVTTEFSGDFDQLADEIISAIEHVPFAGEPIREQRVAIEGFAAELLATLIKECPDGLCLTYYEMPQLLEKFPEHSQEEIQDASYDLQEYGLIRVMEAINGWMIVLDEGAYEKVDPQIMDWDPQDDAVTLAKLMLEKNEGSAMPLQQELDWSKRRFNPAQRMIVDIVPDGCVRGAIQSDYVTIGISITPECRAALKRFIRG